MSPLYHAAKNITNVAYVQLKYEGVFKQKASTTIALS
jgi:hypothetical protein